MRRAAILQVARELFSEVGYAATSMSSIAGRLGGSKATLYKYFRSKEELFAASLEDLIAGHGEDLLPPALSASELEATLTIFCRRMTAKMVSPPFLALFRLVVAESPRFPELGRAYYEKLVAPGYLRVANFLQACMERRLIKTADPMLVATQLLALCRCTTHFRALTNCSQPITEHELQAEADAATATFLAAYRLDQGASTA